jgi:hypothetical protein
VAFFYRLSINCRQVSAAELAAFRNPPAVLSMEPEVVGKGEQWAHDLYPDQVMDKLRLGLAQYIRTEQARERIANRIS